MSLPPKDIVLARLVALRSEEGRAGLCFSERGEEGTCSALEEGNEVCNNIIATAATGRLHPHQSKTIALRLVFSRRIIYSLKIGVSISKGFVSSVYLKL